MPQNKVCPKLAKLLKEVSREVSKWEPWQRTNNDPFGPAQSTPARETEEEEGR